MSQMISFASDNNAACSPEIMAALARVNAGPAKAYGRDPETQALESKLQELFETDCAVFPVATGTGANVLALSAITPSFGSVFCHASSHVNDDECGGTEFYTGGAKMLICDHADGKVRPEDITTRLGRRGDAHSIQPASVSITQLNEFGRAYTLGEVKALGETCKAQGLKLHMDGARFANALVHLGCTPAEATWKAGVDVLSFGCTKNGAMAAEAVIFFSHDPVETFPFRRMKGGHLFSKMRYLSAQLSAMLDADLWLRNARQANAMAQLLAKGLTGVEGIELLHPVEGNELFVVLGRARIERLFKAGFYFYDDGDRARLVCSFSTQREEVEAFLAAL